MKWHEFCKLLFQKVMHRSKIKTHRLKTCNEQFVGAVSRQKIFMMEKGGS